MIYSQIAYNTAGPVGKSRGKIKLRRCVGHNKRNNNSLTNNLMLTCSDIDIDAYPFKLINKMYFYRYTISFKLTRRNYVTANGFN